MQTISEIFKEQGVTEDTIVFSPYSDVKELHLTFLCCDTPNDIVKFKESIKSKWYDCQTSFQIPKYYDLVYGFEFVYPLKDLRVIVEEGGTIVANIKVSLANSRKGRYTYMFNEPLPICAVPFCSLKVVATAVSSKHNLPIRIIGAYTTQKLRTYIGTNRDAWIANNAVCMILNHGIMYLSDDPENIKPVYEDDKVKIYPATKDPTNERKITLPIGTEEIILVYKGDV